MVEAGSSTRWLTKAARRPSRVRAKVHAAAASTAVTADATGVDPGTLPTMRTPLKRSQKRTAASHRLRSTVASSTMNSRQHSGVIIELKMVWLYQPITSTALRGIDMLSSAFSSRPAGSATSQLPSRIVLTIASPASVPKTTSRPTSGSRQRPARARFQEIRSCGQRRRRTGSSAR